jgi:hypothetical protein
MSSRTKAKITIYVLLLDGTWIVRMSYDLCRRVCTYFELCSMSSSSSMALQPCWALPIFQFPNLYTVGGTPWASDQPVARPLPIQNTTQTQNKQTHTHIHALNGIRTHDPSDQLCSVSDSEFLSRIRSEFDRVHWRGNCSLCVGYSKPPSPQCNCNHCTATFTRFLSYTDFSVFSHVMCTSHYPRGAMRRANSEPKPHSLLSTPLKSSHLQGFKAMVVCSKSTDVSKEHIGFIFSAEE